MTLVEVILASATARTSPKSAILTSPSSEINTFSGLMSRCTRPVAVGHRQPAEHRRQYRGDRVRRHRPALAQQLTQRAALDEFHHQERMLAVDALVVHGDQAGILQPRDGARLALKPGEELSVAGVARIHDLQRHRPVQPEVQPAVHSRHPAGGDQGVDAVAPVQHRPDERVGLLAGLHRRHVTRTRRRPRLVAVSSIPAADDVLDPGEDVYDLPDVADLLGVPVTKVQQQLREGHLVGVRRQGVGRGAEGLLRRRRARREEPVRAARRAARRRIPRTPRSCAGCSRPIRH